MRPLILYWNDLSFPDEDALRDGSWAERAAAAFDSFQQACQYHPAVRISVAKGGFHAEHVGRSLLSWLEQWLGRDKVRRIKTRAVQPVDVNDPPVHALACEVLCNDRFGEGMTRAHLSDSWVWSLSNARVGSDVAVIRAQRRVIDDDGELVDTPVDVSNLADRPHADHWRERIAAWGSHVADSCVISHLGQNRIIMYPLDHGYAHIHVQSLDYEGRDHKYRISPFQALNTTPKQLDALLQPWVERHQQSLLESWRRCTKGLHPLKIEPEV